MNSRLTKFLGGIILGSVLITSAPKAEPLSVSEQISQENNKDGILDSIYEEIASGNTSVDVESDEKSGVRANIDVEAPPKPKVEARSVFSNTSSNVSTNKGQKIADFAKSLVGKPYRYGSTGPNSFDCSGFVVYVYKNFGINLPRTSQAQAYVGERVSRENLQPGDLVFSNTYSSLSHVGIYIGNGKFVHAANSDTGVAISSLNEGYYNSRYAWSMRVY